MGIGYARGDAMTASVARENLVSASSIQWFHWAIVSLSLLLTFFAWHYSSSQFESRVKMQFDREADQVIELVKERMGKYEDALWSGVAFVQSNGGNVEFDQWKLYAESIDLEDKYPGINGIGVIDALTEQQVPAYLDRQHQQRPGFRIHPTHNLPERFPITFVVPAKENEKAVGLDLAHETNRYTAIRKARDFGTSQITGPITLVQDSGQTPGFLFYAPFYRGGKYDNKNDRQAKFSGLVYAPFVVQRLMAGTLEKEKRRVGIRLTDESDVMYDEHVQSEVDFDPEPLFKKSVDISLYGRIWTFDIWSTQSFRAASTDNQPLTILLGGIVIDALLILLFLSISRTSQKALGYADSMTRQLKANEIELERNQAHLAQRAKQLETSNAELEQFAYVASHDLQEPLRKVSSFCSILAEEYGDRLDDDGKTYIAYAVDGAARMKTLIQDLLAFSRVETKEKRCTEVDLARSFQEALSRLDSAIEESDAQVTTDPLPIVLADASQLTQLLQNLIGNAIKYRGHSSPVVHLGAESKGDEWVFSLRDNGIGISPQYHDRIFGIFKRLHGREKYSGTGIGLAICKRIVERFDGRIWIQSEIDEGCTVCFTLPNATEQSKGGHHEQKHAAID